MTDYAEGGGIEGAAQRAYEMMRLLVKDMMPAWDAAPLPMRLNWIDAMRAAGPIPQFVQRLASNPDLGESSFDLARHTLGGVPADKCTIVAGPASAKPMRELAEKFGCATAEVPTEMLPSPWAWAMVCADGKVWSVPPK